MKWLSVIVYFLLHSPRDVASKMASLASILDNKVELNILAGCAGIDLFIYSYFEAQHTTRNART